jgi:hypothetical protein
MKSYAKVVEAIKFEVPFNLDLIPEGVTVEKDNSSEESIVLVDPVTGRWRVVPGDYIVQEFKGIAVYKASRFEEEFQEVFDSEEDIPESSFAPIVSNDIQSQIEKSNIWDGEYVDVSTNKLEEYKKDLGEYTESKQLIGEIKTHESAIEEEINKVSALLEPVGDQPKNDFPIEDLKLHKEKLEKEEDVKAKKSTKKEDK